jgi:acetolactate synthase-1/2/3 large subunit
MTAQELATAVQYDLPLVVIVADNRMYGTIRMHQERTFPGRVSGTSLVNPDFAALARSFGATGAVVSTTADFARVFEEALASGRPSLIALELDAEALTPQTTLAEFRAMGPAKPRGGV